MQGQELISVIIPVYNVERYLEKCVDSVLGQTYKVIEVILVDDGSTDRSSQICDEYGNRDRRVIVVHQKNGGLSAARNKGLSLATGDIIYFLDSDDFIVEDALETLYKNMMEYQADISIGNFARVMEGEVPKLSCADKASFCAEGEEKFWNIYRDDLKGCSVIACGKLYRKTLWNTLRFPEGKCHEDEFVAHYLLDAARRVAYVSRPLYYYLVREDSITERTFHLKRLDAGDAFADRVRYFRELGYEALADRAMEVYLWWIIESYCKIWKYQKQETKAMNQLYDTFVECHRGQKIHRLAKRAKYRVFIWCPHIMATVKSYLM